MAHTLVDVSPGPKVMVGDAEVTDAVVVIEAGDPVKLIENVLY